MIFASSIAAIIRRNIPREITPEFVSKKSLAAAPLSPQTSSPGIRADD